MTARAALLAAAVVSCLPARAAADGEAGARRLRRSALAHYRDGAYAEAARAFRAAYEIAADPELLYALGQSLRLAGDCAGAIDAYQDFLITGPAAEQASAAREKIEVCRQVLAPLPEPPAPVRPAAAPPAARPAARPIATRARPSRRWVRDPMGGILFAGGLAAAAGGTWLVIDGEEGEADRDRRTAGGILVGAGAGLVAAAVIRYAIVQRGRPDDDRPSLAAAPEPGGAALWVTGRF